MRFKQYPKYKESGIQWIGKIPQDWETFKFKIKFNYKKGKTIEELEEDNLDGFLPYLSMDYLRGNSEKVLYSKKIYGLVKVNDNDLLLLWDGSNAGEFVVGKEGYLSSTMVKIVNNKEISKSYSKYLCASFEGILQDLTIGMGIPHVNGDDLGNMQIVCPGVETQSEIASFLDKKTLELNILINKDKKLIELLEERRVAVIHNAVTKGLNQKVKMKDSGIEWIGKIPDAWKVVPFKDTIETIVPMRDKPTSFTGEIPWIRIEDFEGKFISESKSQQNVSRELIREMNFKIYPIGTVLCSCSCNMGKVAITTRPLISNQTFIGMVPKENITSSYIYYLMQIASEFLNGIAAGAIQTYLSQDEIKALKICKPLKLEQIQIAEYLDKATIKIDKIIQRVEKKIELLEEYKKSIIHHVMTGKVDVKVGDKNG